MFGLAELSRGIVAPEVGSKQWGVRGRWAKGPRAWLYNPWADLTSCPLSLPSVSWALPAWGPDRSLRNSVILLTVT